VMGANADTCVAGFSESFRTGAVLGARSYSDVMQSIWHLEFITMGLAPILFDMACHARIQSLRHGQCYNPDLLPQQWQRHEYELFIQAKRNHSMNGRKD